MGKREDLLALLEQISQEIEKNPDTIPENVFEGIEHLCFLYNQWHHNRTGHLLTKEYGESERKTLEGGFQVLTMTGGAQDTSEFDKEYSLFEKKLKDIGTQLQEILTSVGIVSFDSSFLKKIQDAYTSKQNPLLNRPFRYKIYEFLSLVVESLRIWILMSPLQPKEYQFYSSLAQTFLDILRGQAKQAALSSVGLFDSQAYMLSVVGRFLLNLIEIITPDLSSIMGIDLYFNSKSILTSLLLWYFANFAPDRLQQIVSKAFTDIKELLKKENFTIPKDMQKELKALDFPIEQAPSYDDILALQTLLQSPELLCDPSIEKLLQPIRRVQSLRLICDLFNIPIGKSEYDAVCPTQTRKVKRGGGNKRRQTKRL
jgi:hypothetical protein